jgi:hypothetical protein
MTSATVLLPDLYPPPTVATDGADADGARLWDRPSWAWSPDVRGRLRDAVRRAAAGEVVAYGDTLRAAGNMLVTVDLTVSPVLSATGVSGVVCSVLEAGPVAPPTDRSTT